MAGSGKQRVPRGLARLGRSIAWRVRSLGRAIYSSHEFLFWVVGPEAWPADLDEAKAAGILKSLRLTARKATVADLPLFRRYHARCGRHLGWGRRRMMLRRWANGDQCYIALDGDGEIVAQVWLAYQWCLIEGRWRRVPEHTVYCYGTDTRPDRQGSLGYVACSCATAPEFALHPDLTHAIAWVEPQLFEKFRMVASWLGLLEPKPLRLERYTRICGLRFCRSIEVEPGWKHESAPSRSS